MIKGYCESFFSSGNGFVPSQIIALLSPTTRPLRERQMQVGTSLFLVRFGFFLLCVRRGVKSFLCFLRFICSLLKPPAA